jgi:hypothetical protein
MFKFYLYAYLREDLSPYYIGKGSGKRIDKKHGKPTNLPPVERRVKLLDNLTEEQAFILEAFFIEWFGRKDIGSGILHNKSNGGEGASGHIVSKETRAKMSASQKGISKPQTPEHKAKVDANRPRGENHHQWGKPMPEHVKTRLLKANLGRRQSPEVVAKRTIGQRGRKLSPEHIYKLKGRAVSDETRTKMSAAHTGKSLSEETKDKIRQANVGKSLPETHPFHISKTPWNKGLSATAEAREKMRLAKLGKSPSEETRLKRNAAIKAAWARRKAA